MTFQPMKPDSCINVTLIDTLTLEMPESFFVTLQKPDDLDERITINTARAETEIYIFDNDGECDKITLQYCHNFRCMETTE